MTRIITPDYPDHEGHITLDARVSASLGKELADEIKASVKRTQTFVMAPLPDRLTVTQKQFASLNNYTELMFATTDRMFVTPYNVMEIKIDRDIDTLAAVENTIADAEQLKQAIQEEDSNDERPQKSESQS